jgi:short-subunit dehydrogenase
LATSLAQPEPCGVAIITGASTGLGYDLAVLAARHGYELLIAANEPPIDPVAEHLRRGGYRVTAVQADLATREGVDRLLKAAAGQNVTALFANAGGELECGFLQQEPRDWQRAIGTHITGTLQLVQGIAPEMCARGTGSILITGSVIGPMTGTCQAVYDGTTAFLRSFCVALRYELRDTGVDVTFLVPGATEMEFLAAARGQNGLGKQGGH